MPYVTYPNAGPQYYPNSPGNVYRRLFVPDLRQYAPVQKIDGNPIMQQLLEQRLAQNPVSPNAAAAASDNSVMGQIINSLDPRDVQRSEQAIVRNANRPQTAFPIAAAQETASPSVAQVFDGSQTEPTPDDITQGLMQDEPADDHGMFSFMNKPGASDALVAFGASMLKAPDFNTGLADASLAVNQVAREQRMPTKQEIARALLKGRLLRAANGQSLRRFQKGETFMGPDGVTTYTQSFDNNTGQYVYENGNTGERLSSLPPGSVRIQNSGMSDYRKFDAKALEEARVAANTAENMQFQLNEIDKMVPTAGIDQGIMADAKRGISDILGRQVFDGFNPADKTSVTKVLREFELGLAQTQKGLGQFTEMERQIVKEALPQIDTTPAAFKRIIRVMEIRAQRARDLYDSWMGMSPQDRAQYGTFQAYAVRWRADTRDQYESDLRDAFDIGRAEQPLSNAGSSADTNTTARPGDKYLQ